MIVSTVFTFCSFLLAGSLIMRASDLPELKLKLAIDGLTYWAEPFSGTEKRRVGWLTKTFVVGTNPFTWCISYFKTRPEISCPRLRCWDLATPEFLPIYAILVRDFRVAELLSFKVLMAAEETTRFRSEGLLSDGSCFWLELLIIYRCCYSIYLPTLNA